MVRSIVLAKVYFTDVSDHKLRPILLCQKIAHEDYLYLPLTTNLSVEGVRVESNDLESGSLLKPSIVIVPKLSVIHASLLDRVIGLLKADKFEEIKRLLCRKLEC
jgi:hypothetical protein